LPKKFIVHHSTFIIQRMDTHLHHDLKPHQHPHYHEEKHFESSELLKDIVIGMSDGLTVPFALAAGLSGAVHDTHIILTAGIAEIIAGSIAMGLGGFLSGKTEIDHYNAELKREYEETHLYPEREKEEVREVFEEYGLSPESQMLIVEELAKDRDKWVNFMMRFELGLEKPNEKRARQAAFNIGFSYIIGGLVPLAPYAIFNDIHTAFNWSVVVTIIALMIFGFLKSKVIGQPPLKGALQTAMIGALAAGTAFLVAKWFSA
jgi:vacuolar iron transporter family protein